MVYQKIINLLDNSANQLSKFRARNWVEINDESRRQYDSSSIKFKTSIIRSGLYDYSDACILVSGTIKIVGAEHEDSAKKKKKKKKNKKNKGVIFKNCAPFTNCVSSIKNIQIDNADYIDLVMPMCDLIECRDNYSKKMKKFVAILQR